MIINIVRHSDMMLELIPESSAEICQLEYLLCELVRWRVERFVGRLKMDLNNIKIGIVVNDREDSQGIDGRY